MAHLEEVAPWAATVATEMPTLSPAQARVRGWWSDGIVYTHFTYDSQARPVQITSLDHGTPRTVTLTYNPAGLRSEYTLAESGKTALDERYTYRDGVLGQRQLVQGSLACTIVRL